MFIGVPNNKRCLQMSVLGYGKYATPHDIRYTSRYATPHDIRYTSRYATPHNIRYTSQYTLHLTIYATPHDIRYTSRYTLHLTIRYTSRYTLHLTIYATPHDIRYTSRYTLHLTIYASYRLLLRQGTNLLLRTRQIMSKLLFYAKCWKKNRYNIGSQMICINVFSKIICSFSWTN